MKLFQHLSSKKGFTLTEILIVIVIIGILVAIAIPVYSDIANTSRNTVCKYNASYISRLMAMNLYKFEKEDRYEPKNASPISLNNLLEIELVGSQTNSNKDRIMNPVSRSKVILHADSPVSGSINDGRNPAVFITGNSSYAYAGVGTQENLEGSIVIYFNASDPYDIEIYYFDKEGNKVELLLRYI